MSVQSSFGLDIRRGYLLYKNNNMADLLSDGVSVEELSGPIYEKFSKSFTAFGEGFIKLQPYNQVVPRCFLKYEKRIKDFQTRPDDVWVASFPKCGKFTLLLQ